MLVLSSVARKSLLGAFLSTTCALASQTVYANLIDTIYGVGAGSFELGEFVNYTCGYCNGFMPLPPGAKTIIGWTVGGPGDGVDWLVAPPFPADTGIHGVDLQHFTNSSIATVIPTVVGAKYELSFSTIGYPGTGNTGSVSAGSLVNQPFAAEFSVDGQTFTPLSFQFTATGPNTTVQFNGTGIQSPVTSFGPVVDSVSVSAVPEPATVWSLASGLLVGLIVFTSRKGLQSAA